jgi:hypothetical protein
MLKEPEKKTENPSKSYSHRRSQSKNRPVHIDVHAFDDGSQDSGVGFWHEWKFADKPGDPPKHGGIDLPANDSYTLTFHLHDDSSCNLGFVCNGADAMWVTSGTVGAPPPCPTAAGNGGQILYTGPCTQNQLEVQDSNSGPECLLKYALRFDGNQYTGPSGRQYPPYQSDPDIKNGGGSTFTER